MRIFGGCILLLYIDNMIALSRGETVLKDLEVNLKMRNYMLTDEGVLSKYLGVDEKHKDNR